MNDLYKIDPNAPTDERGYAFISQQFRPSRGLFICNYPHDWANRLKKHAETILGSIEYLRFVDNLERLLRRSLLPDSGAYDDSRGWLSNAQDTSSHIKAILSIHSISPNVIGLHEALLDPNGLPDANGELVKQDAKEYVRIARPLFQLSPKVVLIDQHFRLRRLWRGKDNETSTKHHRGYRRSLETFLVAAAREGRTKVLRVKCSVRHALEASNIEDFESDLETVKANARRQECDVSALELEYDFFSDDPESAHSSDLHARYVLGNGMGLHFDHGLDEKTGKQPNHVRWIEESVLGKLLDDHFDD